ncbi:hypothetical protein FQR65_LT07106 [Abscondita terminalis]|nr:hypothetical protein FQR65_LT07106 [Abscondita terminalis]
MMLKFVLISGYTWSKITKEKTEQKPATPEFDDLALKEIQAKTGQTVLLPCTVRNLGDKVVSWIRTKDLHILTSGALTFSADNRFEAVSSSQTNFWGLRVRGVRLTDSGRYECQVNTDPKMSLAINLTVSDTLKHPDNFHFNNKWTYTATIKGPPEVYVRVGSPITFTCEISTSSPSWKTPATQSATQRHIHWFHEGKQLSFDSVRGGISVETDYRDLNSVSRLRVAEVSPQDSGTYTCTQASAKPGSTRLVVVQGEHSEAMQRDAPHSSTNCWHNELMLLWAALFLASAGFSINLGLEAIHHYEVRPTVISIERDHWNWNVTFPGATLCFDSIDTEKLDQLMKNLNIPKNEKSEFSSFMTSLALGTISTFDKMKTFVNKSRYMDVNNYAEWVASVQYDLSEYNYGQSFGETGNFQLIFTEFGACYVYNSKVAVYSTLNYWQSNSMKMVHTNSVIVVDPKITSPLLKVREVNSGYKIFFHGYNELPELSTKWESSEAATTAHFVLSVTTVLTDEEHYDLSITQRYCRFSEESNLKHSPVYSYNFCRIECRINLCLKLCNCIPYYYRRLGNERVCDPAGMVCLFEHASMIIMMDDQNITNCDCDQNCIMDVYAITNSEKSAWFLGTDIDWGLKAYPTKRYKRTLMFSKSNLLVQIGGVAGLFLGCCTLSLIELLFFFTLRFYWCIYKGRTIE